MRKIITFLFLTFFIGHAYNQSLQSTGNQNTLFAQGMIDMNDAQEFRQMESNLKGNPYVKIARVDEFSNRFFLLTKDIAQLSEEDLRSWFGGNASQIRCIQIGVYGIDAVETFPFANCQNQ